MTAVMAGIFSTEPRASDRNGLETINRGFFSRRRYRGLVAVVAFIFLPGSHSDCGVRDTCSIGRRPAIRR